VEPVLRWRGRLYERPGCIAPRSSWGRRLRRGAGRQDHHEVGRQPWTVYGLLRTADSVAPVAAGAVATSLVAFVIAYFALFGAGTFYILRLMKAPPRAGTPDPPPDQPMRAQGIMPAPVLAGRDAPPSGEQAP